MRIKTRTSGSFTATISKAGSNPFVDLPARIDRLLAPHATAGRIPVEGTLNGWAFRSTLVPVAGDGHRLYVNGGMRAGAGVDVGDRVRVSLRPAGARPSVPPDVAAALRRTAGATAAFRTLPPSRFRELMRYVDDARTAANWRKRIEQSIAHVLGAPLEPPSPAASARPLWTCPRCGNSFVNRNQSHSCGRHRLDDLFAGKPAKIRELFDRFRELVERCGKVTLVIYRDRVGFMVRVRFAGATPKPGWLDVGFWLTRRLEHPRFHKVETLLPGVHVHRVRVSRIEELDDELAGWLREAYAVGCQEHLGGTVASSHSADHRRPS